MTNISKIFLIGIIFLKTLGKYILPFLKTLKFQQNIIKNIFLTFLKHHQKILKLL